MITIYFDGGCSPINPGGIATYGYLVFDDDALIKAACAVVGEGNGMTNNIAEFSGLLHALKFVKSEGLKGKILILGDSTLVLNIVKGLWAASSNTCLTFLPKITKLLEGYVFVTKYISGDMNYAAHGLCKAALRKHQLKK